MKFFAGFTAALAAVVLHAAVVKTDFAAYDRISLVQVAEISAETFRVTWPMDVGLAGEMIFNLAPDAPLIQSFATSRDGKNFSTIASQLEPVITLTIGERDKKIAAAAYKNMVFFEHLNRQPHATFPMTLVKDRASVTSVGDGRVTVRIGSATAGSFRGDLQFTFFPGSPLVLAETVLKTSDELRAILYDTGLSNASPDWQSFAWMDAKGGGVQRRPAADIATPTPQVVKFRAMTAEGTNGSLAVFALPHRYFYPQDQVWNLKFTWFGRGLGIRQPLDGDDRYVPWFDAPAGVEHRLGVFYLLTPGNADAALRAVASYTHDDHFKSLAGYHTFSSHYHVEHTQNFLAQQAKQKTNGVPAGLENPGFVRTFKAAGVDIVHLAEFHAGDTPHLKAPERLKQLATLHAECARLSDENFLLLPGEEPNVHLGGHWISLFPKPVNWILNRAPGEPFVTNALTGEKIYRVGGADDVLRLMEVEHGLMWTAHARIKASRDFPDNYRDKDFFQSDHFLGAAWKAMPANLSRPTLGWRVLDLFDDMNNRGPRKQVIGEVDVFELEPSCEFYGHANVNYLKLGALPKFSDGWQPVLDTLRGGKFFTTTGEILIPRFTVGGKESGSTISAKSTMLEAKLEWTYPLAFAEVVMGDGEKIFRQRIDLGDTKSFGSRELKVPVKLQGMKWVRFEAWDIAADGAFTQPVWVE
jgi:hypothetical protein